MGCSSTKSQIQRIRKELKYKGTQVEKLNESLKRLDVEIEKLIKEDRQDQVKLKEQDYELTNREKNLLRNEILRLNQNLSNLEEAANKKVNLQTHNLVQKKLNGVQDEINVELDIRDKYDKKIEEKGDKIYDRLNDGEREEKAQNYQRVPKSQTRAQYQDYPPSNQQMQFQPLEPQINQQYNQPYINKVQSGICN